MDLKSIVLGTTLALSVGSAQASPKTCKLTNDGLNCQNKIEENLVIYFDLRENRWSKPTKCYTYINRNVKRPGMRTSELLEDDNCDGTIDAYNTVTVDNGVVKKVVPKERQQNQLLFKYLDEILFPALKLCAEGEEERAEKLYSQYCR